MSDVKTIEKMFEYPARLQMSMLAPVRAMAESIPEGDKEVRVVGYVFGEARGVSYRNNPNSADGEAAIALIGVFEGVPSYESFPGMKPEQACEGRAGLRSGVLFLPPQAQAVVVAAVARDNEKPAETPKRGQRVDQLGVTVPITFEIGIRKSQSPVGYEWVTRGLAKVEQVSPLDRMRAELKLPINADLVNRIADGSLKMIESGAKSDAEPAKALKKPSSKKR